MSSSKSGKEPIDIGVIGRDLNASLRAIMEEGKFSGGDLERISNIFRNRIGEHRDELLSPVTVDGKTINVKRHNGIEEIGHRWSSMRIRRRTGRSQTAKEMGMFGALTAIISNVENKSYIENVFSRMDFLKEFTPITKEELDNARKLIRPNPCEPIIRKDVYRKPVLDVLVRILKTREDLPINEVEGWIQSIKI
ncbi:MAG: hypothetical protein B2I17_07605 [Thermoplasmatales archaeon B_DKE]|nr:MAG: hypothetical protein B2I17_07605 [Thermoplasmatales archaeon B_DKE]